MESLDSAPSLNTQEIRRLKRRLQAQSEAQPTPQHLNAGQPQTGSANVMHPPFPYPAQHDDSMSAAPNNFTFTTQKQTQTRDSNYAQSSLRSIKSSPIHGSAKDETSRATMHWSTFQFGGDGAGGDTQPMDTQTFHEHSDLGSSRIGFNAALQVVREEQGIVEDSEVVAQERHDVDLTDEDEGFNDEEIDVSSPNAKTSPETLAPLRGHNSFAKPLPPQTPLNPSTKRKRSGEMYTPDLCTSASKGNGTVLRGLLGGHMGMIGGVSQLFNQTQVGSSPAPGIPHSDSPFARPSPSMLMGYGAPQQFSMSSPVRPSTSDGLGLNGPVSDYKRMNESQESRARREQRQAALLRRETTEEDDFDDSLPSVQYRQHLQQQKKATISSIELHAPNPMYQSPMTVRSKSVDDIPSGKFTRTPAPRTKARLISPDPVSDTLDVTDLPDAAEGADLEPLEEERVVVPMTSSKHARRSQKGPSQVPSPSSSQRSEHGAGPTQLTIAVQDSQGEIRHTQSINDNVNALTAVQSSARSAHYIQQSQYSMTSETRAIMSQRMHHVVSRDTVEVHREEEDVEEEPPDDAIPSSPPIEFSEHDHGFEDESDIEIGHENDEMEDEAREVQEPEEEALEAEVDRKLHEDVEMQDEEVGLLPRATPHAPPISPLSSQPGDTSQAASKLVAGLRSTSIAPEGGPRERATLASTSTGTEHFDTAATHQTPRGSRGQPNNSQRQSQRESQVSPIKPMLDIAAGVSPRRSGASAESQVLNDLVENMLSPTGREVLAVLDNGVTESPSKRRKLTTYSKKPQALREPSQNVNLPKSRKATRAKVAFSDVVEPEKEVEDFAQKSDPRLEIAVQEDAAEDRPLAEDTIEEPTAEEPVADPTDAVVSQEHMPSSEQQREEAGAKAARAARRIVANRKIAPAKGKKVKKERPNARRISGRQRSVPQPSYAESDDEEIGEMESEERTSENVIDPETPATSSAVRQFLPGAPSAAIEAAPAAHKVLALFKGNTMFYYPAVYLETLWPEGDKCKVRFCDGTVAVVDLLQIRTFDLRVGDSIKVDLDGMRKGNYTVQAFAECSENTYSDANGHTAVRAVPAGLSSTQEPIVVTLENVYLTGTMLATFNDRRFAPPSKVVERLSTPSLQAAPSEPTTPGSRSRRQNLGTSMNGIKSEHQVASGLFSNMLFATTFVGDKESALKNRIAKQVTAHGGSVVENGFEDLFEQLDSAPTSPKKSLGRSAATSESSEHALRLKWTTQGLGFTAVIADRHSTTKKYLQALALGVPCIHHRWISDCIAQSAVLPLTKYLLAAGESNYLDGVALSRDIATHDPMSDAARLENVLARRQLALEGLSIMFISSNAQMRETYKFLVRAAGASNVQAFSNANVAKEHIAGIDYVVCDNEKTKDAATGVLSKQERSGPGRKRKRASDGPSSTPQASTFKIYEVELIKQSLILGELAE